LYNNILVTKSLLFNTTQSVQKTILNSKNEEFIKEYYNFIALRRDIAKYSQLSISARQKKKISLDSLETVANNAEKELSKKAYALGIEITQKNYTWQDIQAKLNKDEALVEIVRIRQYDAKKHEFTDSVQYGIFILKSNQEQPVFFLLPIGNQLEAEYIANYRRSVVISKILDEYSYNSYWKPIKQHLKEIKKVYFAPDGIYHKININTLYNVEKKKYLNEETEIEYITSGKDIIKIKEKKKPKLYQEYQVHLFGYPDFKGQSENRDEYIASLPGTKIEIEQISDLMNKTGIQNKKYLFTETREETIKNLVSPDILHIATHGFFKKNVEKQKESEQYNFYTDNPLNRSGLLLANCEEHLQGKPLNDFTAEDGVLTANECLNLDLHKTELVVLSACETGLGEVKNGEGVYGLQRALREAGAKCLIMSLWKVNDQTTQEFMRLFYENMFAKNQSKKEAFKNAQNALRKKYPEPYYWGAFVMIGE
jgi:CHAT domain-containing protein